MTAFALLLLLATADEKITPKMPIGKDTTVAEGPLTKDGYIDYGAALGERLGKGVTPQTNAVVLLWAASGPKPEGAKGMHPDFFKALGIPVPPEDGDYFISQGTFAREALKLEEEPFKQFLEDCDTFHQAPRTEKQFSFVVAYLKANEKPLAKVIEATKRQHYFNPLMSPQENDEPNMLIGALLPNVQKCRAYTVALASRAMWHLGEKRYDAAWQDILAVHRLSRLMSHGGTMIEYLVAVAIESIANSVTLTYLEHAPLTATQVQGHWKEIAALAPMMPLWEKLNLTERFMYLDCMQMMRRGMMGQFLDKPKAVTEDELKVLASIDYAPILREGNAWYDKMVAAMKLPERTKRKEALKEIEHLLRKKKAEFHDNTMAQVFTILDLSGKTQMKRGAEMVIGLLMPAVMKVQEAEERRVQNHEHLKLAFALAAYKTDKKSYPAKLDDLNPAYIDKVPGDLFSGKAIVYAVTDSGYTFYSVGVNGKDDGGISNDDIPRKDDLVVTMPRKK